MDDRRSSARPDGPQMEAIVEAGLARLTASVLGDPRLRRFSPLRLPDRGRVAELFDLLDDVLFPGYGAAAGLTAETIENHLRQALSGLVARLIPYTAASLAAAEGVDDPGVVMEHARKRITEWVVRLPEVRDRLSLDVQAAYDGDPAAQSPGEIVLGYPGIRALSIYRVAHELYRLEVGLLARLLAECAHAATGIDIHPGAGIGRSFFIDHGTGVVIGETTVIGDHCRIYQGVTLGATSLGRDAIEELRPRIKRHPTLEDHVTVYAGATILGGKTVIGAGSVINGGVFLTQSVPPRHVVRGPRSEITLRSNPDVPPGNYAI